MSETYVTTATEGRGCGTRSKGSPYLCSGLGLHGQPVEEFIIDPPVLLTAISVSRSLYSLIKMGEVNHVLITVGAEHYPSIWSFIEETANFGISRKISDNFPFEKLTPGASLMFFAHSHVLPAEYTNHQGTACRKGRALDESHTCHEDDGTPCTHATRSYAPFLHTNVERVEHGMRIPFGEISFEAPLPKSITFDDTVYKFETAYEEFVTVDEKVLRTTALTVRQPHNEAYVFLAVPITHVEGRESLSPVTVEKAHEVGYETFVLDY